MQGWPHGYLSRGRLSYIEVSRMNEKLLQKKIKQGWNTWDVRSLTSHVFLPDNFALRFAVMDAATRTYVADFGWPEVERFGPHAGDGSYTCVDLKSGVHRLRIETASEGRKFADTMKEFAEQLKELGPLEMRASPEEESQ